MTSDQQDDPYLLSVIIPCYNEAANLAGTVHEVEQALVMAGVASCQLVLVNDCSTDQTGPIMDDLVRQVPHRVVIHNPVNLGFGGSYKQGLARCQGRYVMWVPGDDAHPAEGLAPIMARLGEADMVIPFVVNPQARSWLRQLISTTYTRLVNHLFDLDMPYYNGLALHRRGLLARVPLTTDSFGFNVELIVRMMRLGATYTTVGVIIRDRRRGFSRAFTPRNVIHTLRILLELRKSLRSGPTTGHHD